MNTNPIFPLSAPTSLWTQGDEPNSIGVLNKIRNNAPNQTVLSATDRTQRSVITFEGDITESIPFSSPLGAIRTVGVHTSNLTSTATSAGDVKISLYDSTRVMRVVGDMKTASITPLITVPSGDWVDLVYASSLNLFCAVASGGTNRVMTSTDGITWTARTAPAEKWVSITWSPTLNLFVAVAGLSPYTNKIITSPDGITWTNRTNYDSDGWVQVEWVSWLNKFVVFGQQKCGQSSDGITWTVLVASMVDQSNNSLGNTSTRVYVDTVNQRLLWFPSQAGLTNFCASNSACTTWTRYNTLEGVPMFAARNSVDGKLYVCLYTNPRPTVRVLNEDLTWSTLSFVVNTQNTGVVPFDFNYFNGYFFCSEGSGRFVVWYVYTDMTRVLDIPICPLTPEVNYICSTDLFGSTENDYTLRYCKQWVSVISFVDSSFWEPDNFVVLEYDDIGYLGASMVINDDDWLCIRISGFPAQYFDGAVTITEAITRIV